MYNKQLIEEVKALMTERGISQKKASAEMNVSPAVLSLYLKENYENGNIESVEEKIMEWVMDQKMKKEEAGFQSDLRLIKHQYVPTSISEDVYKRIQYCRLEKGMVILHGDAGIGKSKAAQQYVNDHPNTCLYIQASPSCGTLGNMLRTLADCVSVPIHYNRYVVSANIKKKLIDSDKTIIIDEAQHLHIKALEELRNISDPDDIRRLAGTGIVLLGNTEVYDRMMGKASASFAQLFSRIKMHKFYCTCDIQRDDIRKVFSVISEKGMEKELEFLHMIAKSKWGLRGAVNVYNNAVNNEDITYKGLYAAARDLGIGVI